MLTGTILAVNTVGDGFSDWKTPAYADCPSPGVAAGDPAAPYRRRSAGIPLGPAPRCTAGG